MLVRVLPDLAALAPLTPLGGTIGDSTLLLPFSTMRACGGGGRVWVWLQASEHSLHVLVHLSHCIHELCVFAVPALLRTPRHEEVRVEGPQQQQGAASDCTISLPSSQRGCCT